MKSLLLGCGNSRNKKIHDKDSPGWKGELVTLDMDPNCGADVIWNLENRPLPFPDNEFDEMGAYDVLEHIGKQGDWRGFFDEFSEYHRILKPGGTFSIIVPIGDDHHADPGHTRFFSAKYFSFLVQRFYQEQIDSNTACTDYRWYWKKNFEIDFIAKCENHHIGVILRKP